MKKLSNRLSAVASLVPAGVVADIGTDHAYLPAYLVSAGVCERAIATDIALGPLARARTNLVGLEERIELRKGDGLEPIAENEVSSVILAGMGGDTIMTVLDASGWSFEGKSLVLQPMTKLPETRKWLWQRGFDVEDERLAEDGGTLYRVMRAVKRNSPEPEPWELWAGRVLLINKDPLLPAWLEHNITRLDRALAGMLAGGLDEPEELVKALAGLREMKGMIIACQV